MSASAIIDSTIGLVLFAYRMLIVRPIRLIVNRVRGLQSHTDPRLAFSKAEHSRTTWRQQFDSHSTALQVLANHDLTGRVAMVTGASSGIGFETARAIAMRGAKVILACRCPQLGTAAANKIRTELPSASVEVWQVELASLRSVLSFCRRYMASGYPLHALILNAGVCGPAHTITEDGIELQFQVNHLSQLYLMRLLLPTLLASAPARVVLVSSESHRSTSITRETFDEAHLNQTNPRLYRGAAGLPQYGDSKLCNVLTARFVDKHFASRGIRAFSVHPGNMVFTGIQRQWWLSRLVFVLARPFTKTVEQGAATSVLAAFDPTIEQYGGGYFNNCTPCETSDLGRDPQLADRLWRISDSLLRHCESKWLAEAPAATVRVSPRRLARLCLRDEFLINASSVRVANDATCGLACIERGPRCQGYRLATSVGCQLFEFDRCSVAVNVPESECSLRKLDWVFVRHRAGLPRGRLCPDGFGHGWLGSVYKLLDVADWNEGLARCESMTNHGLTKFADGNNAAEVTHLHWIKANVNSGRSFFVGGFRPGGSTSDPWFWRGCNSSFLPEVWGYGQPNEGVSADRSNVWSTHSSGIDDVTYKYSSIGQALC
uniref:C-type lectin domain-containing protein n=1 Tax=Macrostomum lignano TaxID=282301 RepID=A0A1I8IR54_9PLAT